MKNNFFAIFLSLIFFSTTSYAEKNIEGYYHSPMGGVLDVISDHYFVISSFGIALSGKYSINQENVRFTFSKLQIPEIIVTKYVDPYLKSNPDTDLTTYQSSFPIPSSNQIFIQFDYGLPSDMYFGFNQPIERPKLQKIFKGVLDCLDYSQFNSTFKKNQNNTIILYLPKNAEHDEFSQIFTIPDDINTVEISYYPQPFAEMFFDAKIQNDGLEFTANPNFHIEKSLSKRREWTESASHNLEFAKNIISNEKRAEESAKKLLFGSKKIKLKNIEFVETPLVKMQCD